MRWPELTDAHTLRRLALPDDGLFSAIGEFYELIAEFGLGAAERFESYEQRRAFGLGYPWARADGTVLLAAGRVLPDAPLDDGIERFPLIGFGANAAPARLALKLRGVDPAPLRITPVTLHGCDVVASPMPVGSGGLPAALVPSAGTEVRVGLLELTLAQLQRLTLTEFSYRFGLMRGVRAVADNGRCWDEVFAYQVRTGVFCEDGRPAALAAVAAFGRRFPAYTQEQLVGLCARRLWGPAASPDDLLRRIYGDVRAYYAEIVPQLLAGAAPAEPLPGFVPYLDRGAR